MNLKKRLKRRRNLASGAGLRMSLTMKRMLMNLKKRLKRRKSPISGAGLKISLMMKIPKTKKKMILLKRKSHISGAGLKISLIRKTFLQMVKLLEVYSHLSAKILFLKNTLKIFYGSLKWSSCRVM